eukprot:3953118-Lingulodinium_polyedra.AAC.1
MANCMGEHLLKRPRLGQTDPQMHIQPATPGKERAQRDDGLGGAAWKFADSKTNGHGMAAA